MNYRTFWKRFLIPSYSYCWDLIKCGRENSWFSRWDGVLVRFSFSAKQKSALRREVWHLRALECHVEAFCIDRGGAAQIIENIVAFLFFSAKD